MPVRPIVLIHGYSDRGESFHHWKTLLVNKGGYPPAQVRICSYRSLVNEITVKDIAEGFDRILQAEAGLKDGEAFDAVVHSTGMLVLRSWLVRYKKNRDRVKHLIGLAPATFGSPLAHKGRSWLGAIFKGNKDLGPDFLNSGDQILDALELGSKFTWDLADQDLVGKEEYYGPTRSTPYVFIFCGAAGYGGLRRLVNEPGTDGTVRLAGCALNAQKFCIDLSGDPDRPVQERFSSSGWRNIDNPLWPIAGLNHGTIVSDPGDILPDLVLGALQVSSQRNYTETWKPLAIRKTDTVRKKLPRWQQFVFRASDERGDPIRDYHLELLIRRKGGEIILQDRDEFQLDVHPYSADPSYRCLLVDIARLDKYRNQEMWLRVIADSGTRYVSYTGVNTENVPGVPPADTPWGATIKLPDREQTGLDFYYPLTTTLIDIALNRQVNYSNKPEDKVIWMLPPGA